MGDKIRASLSVKESLFCALMYEDTCQKKKRKQIPSKRKGNFGQGIREAKEETNPRLLEALFGRPNERGKEEYFAHEYVIFYRRGNYLIEGETSPINRSLISSHFISSKFKRFERLSL